ncbi:MAG: cellulase family glycosylhydrolase [Mariniphaga sp.]|nr:cellulase family glycosylhydrolase [Mariniphaga sp.]
MWYLTQPEINKFDQQKIDRLNELITIAGKRGIQVQPSLITGWLDGGIFTPKWIDKGMFTNPSQIDATALMVKTISKTLSKNPYVHSYDFGNEINALKAVAGYVASPDETKSWMFRMYKAFKEGDPARLVTNGIGTGYDASFPVENISPACDYLSAHTYSYFHATILDDPWFGLRTTYSTNMMIAWAKMEGKPVLMQETGISGDWVSQEQRAKYLELAYFSSWAEGAAGFVWWCSHNIDTTFRVKPSIDGREFVGKGKFDPLEYQMGLLDAKNNKFPVADAFKQSTEFSAKLGLDWTDKLPVCYIVVPESTPLNDYFRQVINAYVLAKQNHVVVRFLFENKEVPADAAFLIIPGFSINAENKEHINKYLATGGTVYQSYYNNFAPTINSNQKLNYSIDSPVELLVAKHIGNLNLLEKFPLSGRLKMAQMNWSTNYETLLKVCPDCLTHSINEKGEGVFFKTKIGKGNLYYTRLNLEESLCDTYNPWKNDESYKLYSVLKPEMDIDIDSRFVEFYHKSNAKEEMLILLNHTYENQATNIISKKAILLKDRQNGEVIGKGTEFNISLKPAEVLFLMVERM